MILPRIMKQTENEFQDEIDLQSFQLGVAQHNVKKCEECGRSINNRNRSPFHPSVCIKCENAFSRGLI